MDYNSFPLSFLIQVKHMEKLNVLLRINSDDSLLDAWCDAFYTSRAILNALRRLLEYFYFHCFQKLEVRSCWQSVSNFITSTSIFIDSIF